MHPDISDDKKKALEKLEEYHGIITPAAKAAGIARSTFYRWMDEDAEFKQAVEFVQDGAIDFVESKLFEKIEGVKVVAGYDDEGNAIVYKQPPSDTALIFYLKCKAKKRGYVERQELTGPDGKPLQVDHISGMTIT